MGLFTERQQGYALDAGVDRTRLVDQARTIDRISERYMREAGIGPGMRVLDLGSGMGDVALLAGRVVGPGGHVLGIERSPELLAAAHERIRDLGVTNVDLVEGDVTRLPELDGAAFDAVVGRLILMHVTDPAGVLRAASALVRAGGTVLAMEYDTAWLPSHPQVALWEQTVEMLRAALVGAGMHARMGLELRGAFVEAGLSAPEMRSEQDVGGGPDWSGYEVLAQTVRASLPLITRAGLAP
ncbi:MAG TPA: class I SAM-dependent methyltransferase, partial [Solirubrobacteraceae bacterium]